VDRLRGSTALLTGAAGGLGAYVARSLAAEGVDLALCDLPTAPMDDLVAELEATGIRVAVVPADLTDIPSIEALATAAEEALGPLDILVNNAGVEFAKPFEQQTREELETITAVNVLAVMELTRVVLPGMLERRRGHVINMASLAGKLPTPYMSSYGASKHAIVGFSHSLRAELGPEPVAVTAICPGFISRVGMYGRLEPMVPDTPRELGKLPPERVGEAVIRALRENPAEIIVNQKPMRPALVLAALSPNLLNRALRRPQSLDFARRFAGARQRLERES
jgi:short-subunit dehydrogenase